MTQSNRIDPDDPQVDGFLEEDGLAGLARSLAGLDAAEPPVELAARVLARVQPYPQTTWLGRIRRFLNEPWTVTVTPLRLAAGAAGLAVVLGLTLHWMPARMGAFPALDAAAGRVVFSLADDSAQSVHVIGSFNQWSPNGYALRRDDRTGRWVLEAPLPPGRYEYSFLIDGRRTRPDPNAAITTDDGFGNRNSVLYVRGGASI